MQTLVRGILCFLLLSHSALASQLGSWDHKGRLRFLSEHELVQVTAVKGDSQSQEKEPKPEEISVRDLTKSSQDGQNRNRLGRKHVHLSAILRNHPEEEKQANSAEGVKLFDNFLAGLILRLGGKILNCDFCKLAVSVIQTLVASNSSSEDIKKSAYTLCLTFHIESARVCNGIVDAFAPEILTVLDWLVLSPSEVCGAVLGPDCGDPYNPLNNWNVTFPHVPQPPPVYPTPPKAGSPTLRVLHLSDIHYDSQYKAGTKANCGEPLCCREGSPNPGEEGAWPFGDYRGCDTPLKTLESLFSTLAAQNSTFDYIIWTGDVPAHNVWNQSRADQVNTLKEAVNLFLQYFPGKPVYPSLGNHESSPVNSYPPPFIQGENSISWLYDALADSWKHWLSPEALTTVKMGAYYTVTPYPGFRIISLNMNYCNNQNWWLLLNTTDPAGELQWLITTLQQAEDKGEKVHILGHIPPGVDDCLKAWSWNYYEIVSRYQNTIVGQFFGHVHYDYFEVFYDVETLTTPVGVAYVAPSVTPYTNLNMGYRFYTLDGNYSNSSFQVLDHETFYLNLTKANIEGNITWEFEYSAKAAYNMTNVYPKDWDALISRMTTNDTLLQMYYKFSSKSHPSGYCDSTCKKALICTARSGRSHDPSFCQDLGIRTEQEWLEAVSWQPKMC